MQISIITINYNSTAHTLALIESLRTHTDPLLKYEIIIVDNASSDAEFEKLSILKSETDITIVRSRINNGFAAGNMLGVQHAQGDYYFFLNNDTHLLNDATTLLYSYALSHPQSALLSAQLYHDASTRTTSFKKFPTLLNKLLGNSLVRQLTKDDFPSNKASINKATDVGVISGACMFFDADVFNALGGLDTIFFLYCEEEDISERVWKSGKKVTLIPEAKVIHEEGGSTQKRIAIRKEYYISYTLLLNKHFDGFSASILKLLQLFKLFRRAFRSEDDRELFWFALRGTPLKESLRYQQVVKKR